MEDSTTPTPQPAEALEEHRRDWLVNITPAPSTKPSLPSPYITKKGPVYSDENLGFFEIYIKLCNKELPPTQFYYDLLVRKAQSYPEGAMKQKVRESIPSLFASIRKA